MSLAFAVDNPLIVHSKIPRSHIANMNSFVDIPVKLKSELDHRIAEIFSIYDFHGNLMVANEHLAQVLRWLGCVPSSRDIAELVQSAEFTDIRGAVHLSRFLPVLIAMLEQDRMRPASVQQLEAAFRQIDPLQRRFVTELELEEALVQGEYEPFTAAEKLELRRTTIEQPSGLCWYEKYVYKLAHAPSDCVYRMAAELMATRKTE